MRHAALLVFALCGLIACDGSEREDGSATDQAAEEKLAIDPASLASLSGLVRFDGVPPPRERVQMAGDQFCLAGGVQLSQALLVDAGGGIANVLVHVKEGVSQFAFPPAEGAVLLDQMGCIFLPRVTALRTGQTLTLLNSDPTFHNVRAASEVNEDFNIILPQQNLRQDVRFGNPEIFIPLTCDVHPWMVAQLAVLAHPCFALSSDEGRFEIEGIPAGELLIEARHEVLGSVSQRLVLKPGERREIELVFQGLPGS